jgi:hypothetical protein
MFASLKLQNLLKIWNFDFIYDRKFEVQNQFRYKRKKITYN